MGWPKGMPKKHYTPELRRHIRSLYIYQRMNLDALAAKFEIGRSTLLNWKRQAALDGDDWDVARTAGDIADCGYKYTIATLMQSYLTQHKMALKDIENDPALTAEKRVKLLSSLAFSLREMRQSVSQLNPELNKLAVAMEINQRLTTFVRDGYPQHAAALLEILEPFGVAMAQRYG